MRNVLKRAAGAVMAGAAFFAAGTMVALADVSNGASSVTLYDPLQGAGFTTVLNNVINFLSTSIAIPLAVIMVLIGAFQMMTSAGDPEKFSQGRKTLLYAAIGFAVAILASGITDLISSILKG
ncbi:MAG: pilin [Verrucomicrobiae bacterium]|nr:pilin [Verrucomicrobiae bacterium]